MKSNIWLKRQSKDFYSKEAIKQGFLSRSAFKLIEIEKKFHFLSKSSQILELGSSPGGWSQVICKYNNKSKIEAYDILPMKFYHKNINFYQKDFFEIDFNLHNIKFDLILSDVAPNTTGHKSTDHLKIISIVDQFIEKLHLISLYESNFVCKIFKGSEEKNILIKLKKLYQTVNYFKPKSSRNKSSEIYLICEKFKK
tara:strand:+ start:1725 stop:2315 length:591 start_codon:yes stop_codon:yes gene_type:complete